jgi:hypothetical protein
MGALSLQDPVPATIPSTRPRAPGPGVRRRRRQTHRNPPAQNPRLPPAAPAPKPGTRIAANLYFELDIAVLVRPLAHDHELGRIDVDLERDVRIIEGCQGPAARPYLAVERPGHPGTRDDRVDFCGSVQWVLHRSSGSANGMF